MDTSIITDLEAERDALRAEVEREKSECDKAHKRAGARWKELDAERQNHAITRAEVDKLNNRLLEIHRECGEANVNIVSASPIDCIRKLRAEVERLQHNDRNNEAAIALYIDKLDRLTAEVEKDYLTIEKWKRENIKLRAEVDSLKQHIERLVTEKYGCAKNWYDCRADLAAAVEVLREFVLWFGPASGWQSIGQQELHGRVRSFISRMEVK